MTMQPPYRRLVARTALAVIAALFAVWMPEVARQGARAQGGPPANETLRPSGGQPDQAPAGATQAGTPQQGAPPQPAITPVPKSCEAPGAAAISGSQLPRVASALKDRKTIRILAIGGAAVSLGGRSESGPYGLIERFLEANFKGLDVIIIDRGISGELAADAAERIKTEVGLDDADLVLWQLGTADAMAGVSADDLRLVMSETASWLKERNIDLIFIGVRYAAQLASDPHYQAIRRTIRDVADELGIMRIGRWEADETLTRLRRERGQELSEVEVSDASYVCMSEYLARAIAGGLFGRQSPPRPAQPGQPSPQPQQAKPGGTK